MRVVFWIAFVIVAWVYAGYPLMMAVRSRRSKPRRPAGFGGERLPGISIVVAARNEGAHLRARIENLLSSPYPGPRQIIVASDGSTDDTLDVLGRFGPAVEAVALPPGGKALALNAAVARATHDVLVFADARQRFAPDALVHLVAPLADPEVGGATGELVLDCEVEDRRSRPDRRHASLGPAPRRDRRAGDRRRIESAIAEGVGLYWRYEKAIRRAESAVRSTLGATGAIYALRRSLWRPLPPDTILDDVLAPMRAVLDGYRVVFAERAVAYDRSAGDAGAEARRKIRTLAGNYQILRLEPRLLVPWRNPVWLSYVSHKLGRLVVPYALLAMITASMALADRSAFQAAVLTLQCGFYLLAGYGGWLELRAALARASAGRPHRRERHHSRRFWRHAPAHGDRGAVNA